MICPKKVQKICLFGMMCAPECEVAEDGECADYIRKTLAELEKMQPRNTDPVEAAEAQQEREAIQEETLVKSIPRYINAQRFTIVDEIFETPEWRKDNPMLRGMPKMPCHIPMPEEKEPEVIRGAISGPIGPLWDKAPLLCRLAHKLIGKSPSALFFGCKLGRRSVFYKDCNLCPEYRGFHRRGKAKKEAK